MSTTRRNGQLSSCEPCRKAKLRCDHVTPICERCVRRGQSESCIYHPAPMSRPKSLQSPPPQKRRRHNSTSEVSATNILKTYRLPVNSRNSEKGTGDQQPEEWRTKKPPFVTTGFLGLTSYWAGFDESESSRMHSAHTPLTQPSPSHSAADTTSVDQEQIECGARILILLEDLPMFEKLVRFRYSMIESWAFGSPIVFEILRSLQDLRTTWLSSKGTSKNQHSQRLALSRQIFANSTSPIETSESMSMPEYVRSVAARWETIGWFFSTLGQSLVIISDDHEILQCDKHTEIDKDGLTTLVAQVAEICLGFCDNAGTINDPFIWLLLQQTLLLCHVYGESDYRPWRKLGDLSTTTFALGLHQSGPNSSTPFFLGEVRNRIMVVAYVIDKSIATVLGRPPRIIWEYCDIKLPLDISWAAVLGSTEMRDAAIRNTNAEGWNKEGTMANAARGRIHLLFSRIREKILRLSLSPRIDNISSEVQEVWAEHDQMRRNLPASLQWKPGDPRNLTRSDFDNHFLAMMHVEFLHNNFLLYWVLVKRTGTISDKLTDISREMLGVLLAMMSRPMKMPFSSGYDYVYNLCYVGLPSAGYLSMELLRQSRPGPPSQLSIVPFPRSEIIQNLSIFASHLENAVDPRSSKYDIAQKGLKAIRNVLDRVLSPPDENPPLPCEPIEKVSMEWLSTAGMPTEDGMDLMACLDIIDWGQEPLWNCS